MSLSEELFHVLQDTFHLPSFRPGQLETLHAILDHSHTLCILPTGYGKSLLYQLPSTLLPQMTLVISPLLALMRDQIHHLNHRFHISAASINSDQTDEENLVTFQKASSNQLKILFVAPEQLDHPDRLQFLLNLPLSLIVIDEAHCISTWGHDFRPSYRHILSLIQPHTLKNPALKVLGLTATANQKTVEDIQALLGKNLKIIRTSLERPNIHLEVHQQRSLAEKLSSCAHLVEHLNDCGLIYAATREHTETVSDYLKSEGFDATAYHAGFSSEEKRRRQLAFLNDAFKVMVATNALGMGIDKPNLRFIIHFDIPGSISAYYQEVGRCGRDGLPAQGILLFDPADIRIQEYFISSAQPHPQDFQKVLDAIQSSSSPPKLTEIKLLTGLHPTRVIVVVAELVEQGFILKSSHSGSPVYSLGKKTGMPNLSRFYNQLEVKEKELQQMIHYSQLQNSCRMSFLRHALGDTHPNPCQNCDICLKETKTLPSTLPSTQDWLEKRAVPILPQAHFPILPGFALLNSAFRSPLFVAFMRARAEGEVPTALEKQLIEHLRKQKCPLSSLVVIPSRTWQGREAFAKRLADALQLPLFLDTLRWNECPPSRQGELKNNDQRKANVKGKMGVALKALPPNGTILLLDDYTGSHATLKEATRALKKVPQLQQDIFPVTLATVKWRLGQSGMIF